MSTSQPKEEQSSLKEAFAAFTKSLVSLQRQADAGIALRGASIIDNELKGTLQRRMRPLTRAQEKRLFTGYGPLASFAARADLAYALELVDEPTYDLIQAIKTIRNKFAHTAETLTFATPEIAAVLDALRFPASAATNRIERYIRALQQVSEHLEKTAEKVDDA